VELRSSISVGIASYASNHRVERPATQSNEGFVAATLDLKDSSPLRGAEPQPKTPTPHTLPAKKLYLTIDLPFGSEPEKYEVQLRKAEGAGNCRRHCQNTQRLNRAAGKN
jgi:hypothetical protein